MKIAVDYRLFKQARPPQRGQILVSFLHLVNL